ncbi:mannitol dehydrogenase family protein [Oricola thermophila]|uniref:Mannitol dehydrogenase family protein n=1 Tax=Oricola thermophila TaxID=2742145 RepID=A0A6N1VCV9_9HYPH|nr:mannitol dehydrogenase family protein [Oricola thermophila]QKV18548.1 mannitol dehydrogenase family protein [Oricola thermophila]
MSTEAGLPDKPRLKRSGRAPRTGILHLGPGAFFRAFNAVYTDEAMATAGGDWGITAVSLRSPTVRDQLAPQDCVYTSVARSPDGDRPKIVGAINRVLVAPEAQEAVIAAMADPAVRIVSMTITEKGYCHEPATGRLNADHPDITHDLAHPATPRSAAGFIVAALKRRRANGSPPFTVLSCDNLPSNGRLAQSVVLEFAERVDPKLADWISAQVPFPATMVDRITPATTEGDITRLAEEAGYCDRACVVHEPFRQWVIEDRFAAGRPAWEEAGAQFVDDVEAHELMKLRCLNGTHSALAYLGYLAGFETIADTVADGDFSRYCENLWTAEIVPTIPTPQGENLHVYCATLMQRYRNPAIQHRTWQIAMDGSQKLPQRILGTIRDNLEADRVPTGLCLAVAGWMRYVGGVDENGSSIDVQDPLADRLRAASDSATDPEGKVAALLAIEEVFDPALAADPHFREAVVRAYSALAERGSAASVREAAK